jgi:hypothetical protein
MPRGIFMALMSGGIFWCHRGEVRTPSDGDAVAPPDLLDPLGEPTLDPPESFRLGRLGP